MVFLSRLDLRRSELFYLGLLDCAQQSYRKSSLWNGYRTRLKSHHL